jgi:hypothetical protein
MTQYKVWEWTVKEFYDRANENFFDGKLPKVKIRWSKKSGGKWGPLEMGITYIKSGGGDASQISLNPKYRNQSSLWCLSLLHEMVHVEQRELPEEEMHGDKFHERMRELAVSGAFDPFW